MNERLNQQSFIDLLAEKHGMDKQDAEKFVKEFFTLIEEALEKDRWVKIKGLGTFKLVDVDSRESVNINSGERFQLQGYTKISFIPDNSLRDIINKPFAHFETVVLNENTVLEDTPVVDSDEEDVADEIVKESVLVEEKVDETQVLESDDHETIISGVKEDTPCEEIVSEETPKEIMPDDVSLSKHKLSAEDIIAREVQSVSQSPLLAQTPKEKKIKAEEKSPVLYLVAIILIVLRLCGGALLFIYYPDLFESADQTEIIQKTDMDQPVQEQPILLEDTIIAPADTVKEVIVPVVKKEETTKSPTPIPQKETEKKEVRAPFDPDSVNYIISGTKTTYTIKEGETLTKVALHFYGTKSLWPYIVKHNPDVIKNPDNVPYGTTIKIPELIKK